MNHLYDSEKNFCFDRSNRLTNQSLYGFLMDPNTSIECTIPKPTNLPGDIKTIPVETVDSIDLDLDQIDQNLFDRNEFSHNQKDSRRKTVLDTDIDHHLNHQNNRLDEEVNGKISANDNINNQFDRSRSGQNGEKLKFSLPNILLLAICFSLMNLFMFLL